MNNVIKIEEYEILILHSLKRMLAPNGRPYLTVEEINNSIGPRDIILLWLSVLLSSNLEYPHYHLNLYFRAGCTTSPVSSAPVVPRNKQIL